MLTILDATTSANCAAATSRQDWSEALIAAWSGGNVTARLFAPDGTTLRRTLTLEPFTISAGDDRSAVCGLHLADTQVSTGAPGLWVFRAGSTDIFSIDAGVSGASVNHPNGNIKTLCTPRIDGVTFTPPTNLQVDDWPAWRQAIAANTWGEVSASSIQDVDPEVNASFNPNHPAQSPWYASSGQAAVINAWGSAVWDEANRKLWIPIGGGHSNYAGNECYVQPHGDANPQWVMLRPPSGAIGNTVTLNDGQELTSVYPDGRPRSPHPYSTLCYADGVGPVITRIPAPYADSNLSTSRVFCLDPTTGESRLVFNFADTALTGAPSGAHGGANGAACCYDSLRNRVVSVGIGNIYPLWCTPTTAPGTWAGGYLNNNGNGTIQLSGASIQHMLYIPTIDRYLHLVHYLGTIYHKLIHPVTGVMTDLGAVAGSLPSGYAANDGDGPSGAWCGDLGVVGMYMQTTNTTAILKLTPPGDLVSKWTASTFTVSGSNTVTPPRVAEHSGGGLFQYSTSLRGFIHIPIYPNPTHFFAIG